MLPKKIVNKKAYQEYIKLKEEYDNHPFRVIQTSDPEIIINTPTATTIKKRKIVNLPKREIEEILKKNKIIQSIRFRLNQIEKKAYGGTNKTLLLDEIRDDLIDKFSRYYSTKEVHKYVIEELGYGNFTYGEIRVFEYKSRPRIDELKKEYEKNYKDITIGEKRSRLNTINYLLLDRMQIYQKTHVREDSKEARALLEQARKEVEGDKIHLNIDGSIDINTTLILTKEHREVVFKDMIIGQMIISRVASRLKQNSAFLQDRLMNGYYSKFNGFSKNDNLSQNSPKFPSDMVYNFAEIQENHTKRSEGDDKLKEFPEITEAKKEKSSLVKQKIMDIIKQKAKDVKSNES